MCATDQRPAEEAAHARMASAAIDRNTGVDTNASVDDYMEYAFIKVQSVFQPSSRLHRVLSSYDLQAEEALAAREVPVGCIIVDGGGNIIAQGRNETNASYNVSSALMACLNGLELSTSC